MAKTAEMAGGSGTWAEVDQALIALCYCARSRAAAETEMNAELDAIKRRYVPKLGDLAQRDAQIRRGIESFARDHAGEFDPKRSCERMHGILSFRTSPPAVKPLSRKWTAQRILESVSGALGAAFIRVERAIAKDVLLAERAAGRLTDEQLSQVGLRIAQEEVFSIELKSASQPEARLDAETRRRGDAGEGRRGDAETRGRGDTEERRFG